MDTGDYKKRHVRIPNHVSFQGRKVAHSNQE